MRRLRQLTHVLSDMATVATAAMIFVTIADILMKNIFHRPILGTFELVEFLLVCTVFFGIAEVFRSDTNICVDIVDLLLSPRSLVILKAFGALTSLCFLLLLAWAITGPAGDTLRYPQWTQELGIPFYAYWIPIVAGTVVTIVAALASGWAVLRRRTGGG